MRISLILVTALTAGVLSAAGCSTSDTAGIASVGGLQGQLFANAGPGFHEAQMVVTVIAVLEDSTTIVAQSLSDSLGRYTIDLAPGTYLLYVKESPDPMLSGPYTVVPGSYVKTEAYYNDLRII